jgi:hypothetical protein
MPSPDLWLLWLGAKKVGELRYLDVELRVAAGPVVELRFSGRVAYRDWLWTVAIDPYRLQALSGAEESFGESFGGDACRKFDAARKEAASTTRMFDQPVRLDDLLMHARAAPSAPRPPAAPALPSPSPRRPA